MTKVHKYEVDLSTGKTMRISSAANAPEAQWLAEREIREHPEKHGADTTVTGVRIFERGRWG